MVDVNTNADVKAFGVPVVPAAVEMEDKVKPQVQPVREGGDSDTVSLDNKSLHGNTKEAQEKQQAMSKEEMERLVKEIQKRLDSIGSNLKFGFQEDSATESIVVQIKERQTGEVVRQLPSEELLKLKAKLEDLLGILFDQSA